MAQTTQDMTDQLKAFEQAKKKGCVVRYCGYDAIVEMSLAQEVIQTVLERRGIQASQQDIELLAEKASKQIADGCPSVAVITHHISNFMSHAREDERKLPE